MGALRVAIGRMPAFAGHAGPLQAVAELPRQVADAALADRVTLGRQLLGQMRRTLAGPAQRRLRITARTRLHQGIQIAQQGRIFDAQALASAAPGPHPRVTTGRGGLVGGQAGQFAQPGVNRRARQSARVRHRRDAATSQCTRFHGGPNAQRRFVQPTGQRPELLFDDDVASIPKG